MLTIYDLLKGHDLRSIGKANEVVELVTNDPELFDEVFDGIFHQDKVICASCADAVEKVSGRLPEYIQKKKKIILSNLSSFKQKEVRWHIAKMLGYLKLNPKEKELAVGYLFEWLKLDKSIIVKVMSMQTLSDFAETDKKLLNTVLDEIQKQMINGAPAIKARGKKLLKILNQKVGK
jgi:nucleoid DNA-binding protein